MYIHGQRNGHRYAWPCACTSMYIHVHPCTCGALRREAGERLVGQAVERLHRELEMLRLRVLELRVRETTQALDEEHHRRNSRPRDLGGVVERPRRKAVRGPRDLAN